MSDLLDHTILASVDVHAIWLVIHRHHISFLHDSVLLWQLRLRECLWRGIYQRLFHHK